MDRTQAFRTAIRPAAVIRPAVVIRPTRAADLPALGDFFAGLSTQSRYLRFFAPVTPAPALLRRLCGCVDTVEAVVAVADGVIIGHAMAADRPAAPGDLIADIGVVVADGWQGQGIGSALIRALVRQAQDRGVTSVVMDVLPGNHRVLAMIAGHWPAAHPDRSWEYVTVQVPLPGPEHPRPAPHRPARTPRRARSAGQATFA
jgi:ribosomal protein S18 acetylase RimI-like enzyme